jgi:hypothetical protein
MIPGKVLTFLDGTGSDENKSEDNQKVDLFHGVDFFGCAKGITDFQKKTPLSGGVFEYVS